MIQNHTQPKHKCRQQGHVAHKNTLDSRPQSNLFLLFLPPLLFDPFSFCFFSASAFSPSSTLRHTVVSLSHIFIHFHTAQLRTLCFPLLAMSQTASYLSLLLCSSHVFCHCSLFSCFLFALLLLWVSVLRCFCFLFFSSEVFLFFFLGFNIFI